LGGGASGEFTAGGIDFEDADQVGAEVWREEVLAGWVLEDGVRVGSVLPARVGPGLGHGEGLLLEDLGAGGEGELVGLDGGGVAAHTLTLLASQDLGTLTTEPWR
jgi:hypothetical protein